MLAAALGMAANIIPPLRFFLSVSLSLSLGLLSQIFELCWEWALTLQVSEGGESSAMGVSMYVSSHIVLPCCTTLVSVCV